MEHVGCILTTATTITTKLRNRKVQYPSLSLCFGGWSMWGACSAELCVLELTTSAVPD